MNRLSPLIRTRSMAYVPLPAQPVVEAPRGELMQDVREFLVGWLGGLVFFGTFLA